MIGSGAMAREHIRAFTALNGVTVSGILSRTRSKAEALAGEFGISHVCDSVEELKEVSSADLVVVAVSALSMNSVAKECFHQDWYVLLEKPAGHDLADAEDIAASAIGCVKPVLVGFNRRFYGNIRAVRGALVDNVGLRYVHVQDAQSFTEAREAGHPEEVVQSFMYANSIHVIDLIRHFCRGEIVEVERIMPWRGAETEIVLSRVLFESGDVGLYEGLWQRPGPWTCAVSTKDMRWCMQPLERTEVQAIGERQRTTMLDDPVDLSYKPGFFRQAQAAIDCIRLGSSGSVSLAESLQTMRLIYRIYSEN